MCVLGFLGPPPSIYEFIDSLLVERNYLPVAKKRKFHSNIARPGKNVGASRKLILAFMEMLERENDMNKWNK